MFVDGISRVNEFDAHDAFARSVNGARYDTHTHATRNEANSSENVIYYI